MKKNSLSKYIIHYGSPVLIFFFISLAYFVPDALEGRKLFQSDIMHFQGMSKEIVEYRESTGKEALWTDSMFGGMPAYLISTVYKDNILRYVHQVLTLFNFRPVCFVFLYMLGFYIALLLFDIKPWLSFSGAIAYAFSSYFFIIIVAGHVSKVFALGYMPPVIAGVYVAFRGKAILGSLVAGIFLGLQIVINHLQITYYTFLIILILVIFELYYAIKDKNLKGFLKPIPWLILFSVLAIGANFATLWTTYEYGKHSIRGASELTSDMENKTSGLDKDYATQWSYGIGETFTLLVPDFKGGSSSGALKTSSHTYDYIRDNYGASQARSFVNNVPLYFGMQPSTSGPVYVGATVFFLFILGLFIHKGRVKWWLLAITVISILLAWGKNFPALTNFMLNYFPAYNKFRTVSMTLVIAEFAMPLLAILTVRDILQGVPEKKAFLKAWKYSLYGLGILLLIILIISGSFNYDSLVDDQLRAQGLDPIVNALHLDRMALLRADTFRSLIFVILTAFAILAIYLKKVTPTVAIILMSGLFLIDMWPVNKRYLNSNDFVSKKEFQNPYTATTADQIILQDQDPDYRVLNIAVSTFQDASTSYFHKSIGGYHGAKMRRYQELIDNQLTKEISSLINTLQNNPSPASIDSTMATLSSLNMLNTRYVIYNPDAPPLVNDSKLGNAWFISTVKLVPDADEEMEALNTLDPAVEAVVDERYMDLVQDLNPSPDSTDHIILTEYQPNYLSYASSASSDQVAIFSEIYYEEGWQAYIDGQPAPHFRADYVLRAMQIPQGEHTIEFRFHPRSYFAGEKISLACSILFFLLIAGSTWRKRKKA